MPRSVLMSALALATLAVGCGRASPTTNKAGARLTAGSRVIVVESANAGSAEAVYFADRIAARSRGALRAEIRQSFPATIPRNEARLARAVRAGTVEFGILPARAWPAAGVPAFAALQAPFVLGDYDVARRAIAGPAGGALEHALARGGVVPLALVPAQLRRVLAVKPLVGPADFRGLSIRVNDNDTSAADLRALGAKPIQGITNDAALVRLARHRLAGVETAPVWAVTNQYWRNARHITAYALFDSVDTLVASPSAWQRLTAGQQQAIRAAAADTARFSSTLPARDRASLEALCRAGVRVTTPGVAQLEAIAGMTERVRAALRSDRATARVMRLLEATDGAGPKLLPPPKACSAPLGRPVHETEHAATIPNGVYVTRTTRRDYGQNYTWPEDAYTWTTRLHDGNWVRTVVPAFPDQVGDVDGAGTYEVHGDEVTFRYTKPVVDASSPETLRWSYYHGRLTLAVVDVADDGARGIYSAHPWTKVR